MVQEVQTGVGITNETTLETIEAIGTSSFKIIEGRQTKGGHYASACEAAGTVHWDYHEGDARDSGNKKSTDLAITSSFGRAEYSISNYGVRVPAAGTYQITLDRSGGGSTYNATILIMGGSKTLYTKEFTSSTSETVTFNGDLGKFETIEVWGSFYYKGSATGASFTLHPTLKIQQL